jgi:hypothetical protein
LLSTTSLMADELQDHPQKFRVTRSDFTFSTIFDVVSDLQQQGSVVKSIFHLRAQYDSYDPLGNLEAYGIRRLLSLGAFCAWGAEIDIYYPDGNYLGMIDGQIATSGAAKFSFYDGLGNPLAVAYLDRNCLGFSVTHPEQSSIILARLTRNYNLGTIDSWDVLIYEPAHFPPEMIKIFAAFACDTQRKFKADH